MTGRTKLMIALAAAGVAVGVFFLMRDGDEAKATGGGSASASAGQPSRDLPDGTAKRPARGQPNDRRDPGAATDPQAGSADPDAPITYDMEDGTHVADHRGSSAQPYLRPGVPHPDRSKVDGKVSTEVLHQVRPLVIACLASLPDDAFTAEALVMARATISIDGEGNLTATELGADGTGVDATKLPAVIDCIRAGAPKIQAHVDHIAVDTASLAFPIRPLAYRR